MAINFPKTPDEVINRIRTDVLNQLPNSNPFLKNSFINAICVGTGGRDFEQYKKTEEVLQNLFLTDSTQFEYVLRWGTLRRVFPNPASAAEGFAQLEGTAATIIPAGTNFQNSANNIYSTQAPAAITNETLDLAQLSSTTNLATAITQEPHTLASGITGTMSGATSPEYNVTAPITVVDENTFTYPITGNPGPEGSGATIDYTTARLQLKSDDFGSETNALPGEQVSVTVPIPGADTVAYIDFNGLSGGADSESEPANQDIYYDRVLFAWQNPSTQYNENGIITAAREVPGVTRVFPFSAFPVAGDVTVYFMRDNDPNPIPGPIQVQAVYDKLLEIKIATQDPGDLFVLAPTPLEIDFLFSNIVPNTSTMRDAIRRNLEAFFTDSTTVGQSIPPNAYNCAIFDTVDTSTGDTLQDFTLTSPLGTIIVDTNEIPILGTVSFVT